MAATFSRGQKSPLSNVTNGTDLYVGVSVEPNANWDIICFGLDADDQLSDDRYMIFYNAPESPEGSIQKLGAQAGDTESFRASLDTVPEHIAKLSFCATLDGGGTARDIDHGYFRLVAGGEEVLRYAFTGADFDTEKAIIIGTLYRKGVWRVSAEGQGFAGGLGALVQSFGGAVDSDQAADPAPPAAAPPGFAPPAAAPPGFAPPAAAPAPPAASPGFAPPAAAPAPPAASPGFAPAAAAPTPPAPAAAPLPAPAAAPPPVSAAPPLISPPGTPDLPPPAPAGAPAAASAPYADDLPSQTQPTPPGAMVSLQKYRETPTSGRWTKQNSYMIKVTLGPEAFARRGAMVAYQGDIDFGFKGPGNLKAIFEQKITGQSLSLMTCKGQGEVFLAVDKMDLHIVELQGRTMCVSSANVLALDTSLRSEIRRIESPGLPGGGFYYLEVSGDGAVVVATQGPPVTLPVDGPTYADVNSVVAWSAGQRVSVTSQVRVSRTIVTGVSGETYNMQFMAMGGEHFAVVQPFEV